MSVEERIGKYVLVRRLALGGMGEVHLARDPDAPDELVVVKRLLPQFSGDRSFTDMLFDEARIISFLRHKGIAALHSYGLDDGNAFLAMEYVRGRNFAEVLEAADEAPEVLSLAVRCRVIVEIARALDHAHHSKATGGAELNLIHRDISPANLMLAWDGGVKLIDFGVAKAANRLARTGAGVIKGKYSYMSPEQADDLELDARSDLFSLGIVMHEALTLRRLFRRRTEFDTLEAVATSEIPAPSSLNPEVPAQLDAVVLKALQRDVERRYQTAGDFADSLAAALKALGWKATAKDQAKALAALFPTEGENRFKGEPTVLEATDLSAGSASDWLLRAGTAATVDRRLDQAVRGAVSRTSKVLTRDFVARCFELSRGEASRLQGLGAQCFRALVDGATFEGVTESAELGASFTQLLAPAIKPGARFVTFAGPSELRVAFKGEALPAAFFAGALVTAVELALKHRASLHAITGGAERYEISVTW